MTRRTIIYKDKTTGKTFATPEFNGDKTEFTMFQMNGECDADWDDIQKEFSGVKTLQEFIEASEKAQKHYKPATIYNSANNTIIKSDKEILTVSEIGDIYKITSDYILNINGEITYIVEGTKEDGGFDGFEYCDEFCENCMNTTYNIPVSRVSLCAHCGAELFPCVVCNDEDCDWSWDTYRCHKFKYSEEWICKCKEAQLNESNS